MAKTQMYRNDVLSNTQVNLYPVTEAKYVTMNDGQTVEEMMSNLDTDKYSPVIESSKAMFKVGEGDSVDLSESAIDGAYNSCVLKGKTMVNCIQEPSSQDVVLPYEFEDGQYVTINDTKESGALGVELKGNTLVNINKRPLSNGMINNIYYPASECDISMLKTNTQYLVCVYNDGDSDTEFYLNGNVFKWKTISVKAHSLAKVIGTTKSEILNNIWLSNNMNQTTEQNIRVMLIEYQEGMENWDIPYFEGMTSCKMPILTTIGKNLFNLPLVQGSQTYGTIGEKPILEVYSRRVTNEPNKYIKVKPNTQITFSIISNDVRFAIAELDEYGNSLGDTGWLDTVSQKTITTKASTHYIGFNFKKADNANITVEEVINSNPMLEYSNTPTSYEPYKSSILSTPSDLELCGIGDVCDTLDLSSGELSQRIGEVVLDGTETDISMRAETLENTLLFRRHLSDAEISSTTIYSDKFDGTPISWNEIITSDKEFIRLYTNDNNALYIRILKSKLETEDVDGFRNWLTKNPLTIKYQRSNVVNKAVDLKVVDQNGNVIPTLKSWNTTTHIYSEIPENTLYPILSHSNPSYPVILKPSTKYSIVANSYSNDHTNSAINFNLGGATDSTTVGNRVTTITTPSALTSEELVMSGRGNKLKNVMVIEGDVAGDEPYFEGICDVKSPILLNCGKNLAKLTRSYTSLGLTFKVIDDTLYVDGTAERILDYYLTVNNCENSKMLNSLEVGTMVTLSNSLGLRNYFGVWRNGTTDNSWFANTMTIQSGDNNIRCFIRFDQGSTYNNQAIKIQLEATQNPTTYEPYKSNTTTFDQKDGKTIVLRSLPSGVCDTLNVETGEYVQRIGEVVLDGEIGMWLYPHQVRENTLENAICFQTVDISDMSSRWGSANMIYCDKLHYGNNNFGDPIESTYWGCSTNIISRMNKQLVICIDKTETNVNNQNELVNWLKSNPLTVQYKLETPIVSTIDVQGFPYAYKDGHVQLSSGSIKQSLTPKVEYSLVANKSGQIDNNTKMTIRHDKQINEFENVMLVSLLESSYQKTLMKFNFDMQMMNVGGEEQCQN